MKRFVAIFVFCIFTANSANAAVPTLPTISQAQLDNIVKEFSANFTYTNASPPSVFGKKILPWLGFEFGLVAGITKSPELDTIVTTEKIGEIPHVGIFTGFSFPYGLAFETLLIPKTKIKDVNINYTGLAGKWTVTDVFWEWLPIDIAVKSHWAKATVSYGQTINNASTGNVPVNANIELSNAIYGGNASVGYDIAGIGLAEVYAGVGFLMGKGQAKVLASTGTIFAGLGFTGTEQSASSSPSSAQIFGGLQINLFVVNLSAEAMRAFGTNNYTGKFSFDF